MAQKPIIAYVERNSSGMSDDNPYRDALSYFLREHCGCEVALYDYDRDFTDDVVRLDRDVKGGRIIAVIVKQEEYDNQHERIIAFVRANLSKSLPVVVLPDGWGDKRFEKVEGDPLIYAFHHTDPDLVDLIKRLVSDWKPGLNWLGAETVQDQNILLDQLENAYKAHYDDDGLLGSPDRNHMIVAEALRLKLLPSMCLKAEFDDTLVRSSRVFVAAQPSVYFEEVGRIRAMDAEQRKQFDHALLRARGYELCETGGVFVTRATCGHNVNGFAIDPVTMETYVTRRFGEHHMAKDLLARRIEAIEMLKKGRNGSHTEDDEYRVKWRLLAGLILSEIDGFKTPILRLYPEDAGDEVLKKVASFVLREQKFIPVDHDGNVIE